MKSGGSRSRAALSVGEGTLSGQVALVTGEARGLGKELVRALAAAGASLAVLSRNQADCDSVIIELAENGTAAVGVEAARRSSAAGYSQEQARIIIDAICRHGGQVPVFGTGTKPTTTGRPWR